MSIAKLREFKAHYTSPEFEGFIGAHGLKVAGTSKPKAGLPLHVKLLGAETGKPAIRITFHPAKVSVNRQAVDIRPLAKGKETLEKARAIITWHYARGGYGDTENIRFGHAGILHLRPSRR